MPLAVAPPATEAAPAASKKESPTPRDLVAMPAYTFGIPVLAQARSNWAKGGGGERLMEILRSPQNHAAFRKLMVTTNAMFTLPLACMALCHYVLLDWVFTFRNPQEKVLYSGVVAIIIAQVVAISFVVAAFREPTREHVD